MLVVFFFRSLGLFDSLILLSDISWLVGASGLSFEFESSGFRRATVILELGSGY